MQGSVQVEGEDMLMGKEKLRHSWLYHMRIKILYLCCFLVFHLH